jgi:uncharacterized glyoxalase superfamily protein PhnB
MSEQPEFYPMTSFPILTVADVEVSSRWYLDVLGFAHVFTMPGPGGRPGLAHLRWTKYADLLLRAGPPLDGKKGVGISLNFAVSDLAALNALAERAKSKGATFIQEPGDRPWNARDFTVADPEGFALTFTAGPLKSNLTMDALMGKTKKD